VFVYIFQLVPLNFKTLFKATLSGDQKTNNLCEGFNRGFKLSVPANASDWAIMDRFKAKEAMAKQSIFQVGCMVLKCLEIQTRHIHKKLKLYRVHTL
jgi:hypothetical protein